MSIFSVISVFFGNYFYMRWFSRSSYPKTESEISESKRMVRSYAAFPFGFFIWGIPNKASRGGGTQTFEKAGEDIERECKDSLGARNAPNGKEVFLFLLAWFKGTKTLGLLKYAPSGLLKRTFRPIFGGAAGLMPRTWPTPPSRPSAHFFRAVEGTAGALRLLRRPGFPFLCLACRDQGRTLLLRLWRLLLRPP